MRLEDITVGKYYISRFAMQIREITIDCGDSVQFITYSTLTGNPVGGISVTHKLKMLQWAEDEATPVEIKKLKKTIEIQADNSRMEMIMNIMKAIPNDILIYEIKKRGIIIK
jgi:hypothetical protein